MSTTFGSRLKNIRTEKGMKREVLASLIATSSAIIGRYEREEAKPSIDIASELADIFKVSLDYLVGRTELLMDENISARILTIQKLSDTDREHILFTIDALIRDFKTKQAYAS